VTDDRALSINSALVDACMVRARMMPGRVPDVTWFTPEEAEEASILLRDTGVRWRATNTGFIDPIHARALYAWTLPTWADGGEP
jgi:hypothetical protein